MSSPFAQLVKAQRIDQKAPGRRKLDVQIIQAVTHHARTAQLITETVTKKPVVESTPRRFWSRIVRALKGD